MPTTDPSITLAKSQNRTNVTTSSYKDGDFSFGSSSLFKENSICNAYSSYFKIPCDRIFPYLEYSHQPFDIEKDLSLSSLRGILYTANLIVQLLVEE